MILFWKTIRFIIRWSIIISIVAIFGIIGIVFFIAGAGVIAASDGFTEEIYKTGRRTPIVYKRDPATGEIYVSHGR